MSKAIRITCAFLFLTLVGYPNAGGAEDNVPEDRSQFHLFLLVGQSNMAGRGEVRPEDRTPHERVLMLNKAGKWVPAVDPLHFDKPIAGSGLGKTFAIEYAEANPEVTVGLIPCAVGGSPISTWQPGATHKSTGAKPYDDAIRRAKLAQQSGKLKGLLWHQGEGDSRDGLADVYESKLHALIHRFRDELDAPEVPFIVGQLGQFDSRPWNSAKKKVDAAHRSLPEQLKATGFVSSDGLTHKGDDVHFDRKSLLEFGHRYFEVYRKVAAD